MIMCSGTYGQYQPREAQKTKNVEWDGSKCGNTPKVSRRRFCLGDPHFSKFVVGRKSHCCHSLPSAPPRGGLYSCSVLCITPLKAMNWSSAVGITIDHVMHLLWKTPLHTPAASHLKPLLSTVHHALFCPSKTYAHITEINRREK